MHALTINKSSNICTLWYISYDIYQLNCSWRQFHTSTHIKTCLTIFNSTNYLHLLILSDRYKWHFSDIFTFTWTHCTSLTRHAALILVVQSTSSMIGLDGRWEKLSSLIGCAVSLHKSCIYSCTFLKFVYFFDIFGLLVSKPLLLWIITKHIITNQGLSVHKQKSGLA